MVAVGTQLGAYTLIKLLGSGGMGSVYLAEHALLKNRCAVKVLAAELRHYPDVVHRFVAEARAAAHVLHRNLIRVFDIAEVPGGWYMVLEYLEGETLARFMASQGCPVAYDVTVRILSQVANALYELHKLNIVHRDVKADNIFLVSRDKDDSRPILLDLGVASVGSGLSDGPRTSRGAVLGTPIAMAPEQLLGEPVGPEADVYALGVLLYEMSTGFLPYQMEHEPRDAYFALSTAELYRRQMAGRPVDPRQRNPNISDAWARTIFSWLEPERASRTANTKDAIVELARAMPVDGAMLDGFQIVEKYAGELLTADEVRETVRGPAAAISPTGKHTRYVFGERLGSGGMAEVYAGTELGERGFETPVAFKRVLTDLQAQPGFAAMLVAEARIASSLKHRNIVSVLNLQTDDQERLFLVMERVHGKDLGALLATGPLRHSLVVYILGEALRGLAYAHNRLDPVAKTRGIVHRDISPENLLLSFLGEVKINDFGLARALDATGRARSHTIRGRPQYMSPEQVRGEELDNRSDLWAIGVMLWEMLTHRAMLAGTTSEVMSWVLHKELVPPRAVRADVPADLDAIATKLLDRELDKRYQRAEDVLADLLACDAAPRNGIDELAAELAMRFPQIDAASARRGSAVSVPRPERPTTPITRTTLGHSASEVTPRHVPRPSSPFRRLALLLVPISAAGATFLGARAFRRHTETSSASITVETVPVARGGRELTTRGEITPDAGTLAAAVRAEHRSDAPVVLDAAVAPSVPAPTSAGRPDAMPSNAGTASAPVSAAPHVVPASSPPPTRDTSAPPRAAATAAAPTAAGSGELVIVMTPWAAQVLLNGKRWGETPFHKTVPAGTYVVRLVNEDMDKHETFSVTVPPNRTTEIRRTW